ncbi:helix-turn-helix domain-containing protein [Nocardioides pantholopis]|uniref:helix-turn-helix domain-containing protein n=1 Tax=Nocardioides pantholopis TaxID=2483798 RepID=UPI0013E37F05|nr:helix-turn-helix domain-containing protein [Nocardioides pantholopis]
MSVEALAVVLHHSRAKGTDKLVLLGIANHAGDGGAWPSITTLAKYANVHERNVQRALDKLVELGEVAVYRNDGGDHRTKTWARPNRYDVLVACPATCDRTANHRIRELPRAPADLWIEGVAPAPGGGASATGGVAPAPGGGVAPAPPEPSLEPTINHGGRPASTTDRACATCLLPEPECQRRSRTSGHAFTPKVDA